MTEEIELKRHPDVCCPEPSCDNIPFDFKKCKSCQKECDDCKVYEAMKELTIDELVYATAQITQ